MAWLGSTLKESMNVSTVFSIIILTLTVTWLLQYTQKRRRKAWLINQVPGPTTVPIFGNALEVNVPPRDLLEVINSFCDHNVLGLIVRVWIGFVPYIIVSKSIPVELFTRIEGYIKTWCHDCPFIRAWTFHLPVIFLPRAHVVETILSSQKHIDKSRDYSFLHPWLGTGLLTATGKKWHSRRKMLTPAFHFKILEDFVDVFNQQSFRLVSNLEKKADGKPFDIFQFITLCTLDIIMESAMGRSIDAQNHSDSDYVKSVYKIGAMVQKRQSRPWLQPDLLFRLLGYASQFEECLKILHGFSYETIRQRRREFKETQKQKSEEIDAKDDDDITIGKKKKKLAFLDLLLEYSEENGLSDEDIREEVDTFMFEGHDTTAAAINWSIYLIGSYPEVQEKVHEELDSVFRDSDRPITSSDLKELKYLECCIKEALRLFPSVPFIGRELKEEVVIDGYTIPSGTTAIITTYRLHRDPVQFPNPEQYEPERFFPENSIGRHPYAYVPFSAGPRNCIGQKFAQMEEKIVLANLFRKYRVESTVRREDLSILGELILRPEEGNVVKLFRRSYQN